MEFQDILNAQENLKSVLFSTPLITVPDIQEYALYIKPENLQRTGSFKIRGAYNKICLLDEEEKARGVITSSAGNHAQGVAFAAREKNIHAVVCMPKSTPEVKVEATRRYGAEIVLVDGVYDDAYQKALELQAEYGYTFVHPFNDIDVIAGQGTIGVEILRDNPEIDTVIVPVGGGGLISGIAYAVKSIRPDAKVYGVQALGAPGMYASLAAGYVKRLKSVNTMADGIAVKQVGNLTLDFVSRYVDDIITVKEREILEGIKILFSHEKLVAEGAGAASYAALLAGYLPLAGRKVAVVLSGGNIDLSLFSKLMTEEE